MDQQRPTRSVNGLRPRRMDGFARPAGGAGAQGQPVAARPAGAPRPPAFGTRPAQAVRPTGVAPERPAQPQPQMRPRPRPAAAGYQAPARQQLVATQPEVEAAPRKAKATRTPRRRGSGGGWKVVLQFVVGLVVIVAVAGTIVWLYVRYYG